MNLLSVLRQFLLPKAGRVIVVRGQWWEFGWGDPDLDTWVWRMEIPVVRVWVEQREEGK